jgi:Na+/serine symporter
MRAVSAAFRASSLAVRRLRSVPQPLPFLSDCFEGLAMVVADLTRFLRQSSEPFSLVPACLRGAAPLAAQRSVAFTGPWI